MKSGATEPTARSTFRQIVLGRRPQGALRPGDLVVSTAESRALLTGEVRLAMRYISLDPATRGWMDDKKSYMKPIALGDVVRSGAIGEVVETASERFATGDRVIGLFGWAEEHVAHEREIARVVDSSHGLPLSYELSGLGGNGLTAYFGLNRVGRPQSGDTVLVSAAAGGVGSIVGQLARLKGCRVVGIVGSERKRSYIVDELGYHAAINRKEDGLGSAIASACPDGVDVYFDNTGGEVLNETLRHINTGARVVLCGAISQINETSLPPGPSNYIQLLARRASMQGFVTMDYYKEWSAVSAELAELVRDGNIKVIEEIVDGIENVPQAFERLFTGEKLGKLTIRI